MKSLDRANQLDLTLHEYAKRLFDDYVFFIREIYHDRQLTQYGEIGEVEADIASFLAYGPVKGGHNRRCALAWRAAGKTHWGSAGIACWRLYRDNSTKILIASKSESKSKEIVNLIKGWLSSVPFLEHLFPRGQCRNGAHYFDCPNIELSMAYSVFAVGVDGTIEGRRAHLVICDDIETDKNTQTVTSREFLKERVAEFESIAAWGEREVIYVGTYHHVESLYFDLSEHGFEVRTWPLEYPAKSETVLNLAPLLQRHLLDGTAEHRTPTHVSIVPHYRYDEDFVYEKRARPLHYAMQYMLLRDMGDEVRYPLRLNSLIVPSFALQRDKAPLTIAWGSTGTRHEHLTHYGFTGDHLIQEILMDDMWGAYADTIMWIDPAGSGSDETAYAIVSQLNGYLWTKAVGGWVEAPDTDMMHRISKLARDHDVKNIYVEDRGGYGTIALVLEPIIHDYFIRPNDENGRLPWACSVDRDKTWGGASKEDRIIDTLSPVMGSHRLVIDRDVIADERLQKQIAYLCRQRGALEHDDRVEALAACVFKHGDAISQDPRRSAEKRRENILQRTAEERLRRGGFGKLIRPKRWMTHSRR